MPDWRVMPTMWEGQACAILASGPSMSQEVADAVRWAHWHRVIAINNTVQLAPWADMLYAADAMWWNAHKELADKFDGLKVTVEDVNRPDVLRLKVGASEGFEKDRGTIATGGNSGYQALHIAAHAGCKRILLCGYDMRGGHWHGPHKSPLRNHGDTVYEGWIKRFQTLVAPLNKMGVEVLNCTPGSALKIWPHVPLEQALQRAEMLA